MKDFINVLCHYLAANVHDLYKQASIETYGGFLFLAGIAAVVIAGGFTKVYFEGPSCPSSAKLTGKHLMHWTPRGTILR